MNSAIIKEEIKWLLEAINEQYGEISLHGDAVPQIEFDILMENLRKLYEDLHMLKRMGDPHFVYDRKIPVKETPPAPARAQEIRPSVQADPVPAPPIQAPSPPPAAAPATAPAQAREPVTPFRPEPAVSPRKPAQAEMPDLFASDEPAFSTRLREARERTFGPKVPSEKIDNLKTAIVINDKFMFINELFEGNLREYNETIETLNGFKTLTQAADYLDLMRKKNFWNTGSPAFKRLKELVERKF